MTYLVTGATGFVGRFLVERLARRGAPIYATVRPGSEDRLTALRARLGLAEDRLVAIPADLAERRMGVRDEVVDRLRGQVGHVFHLAAIYDLRADAERQRIANVDGTEHLLQLADAVEAGTVHHVSSIAAAGRYRGTFTEEMFEEATGLDDPYFRTKHESEAVVRERCTRPWRIYRPAMVVGHSRTGEMDKVDGPYYFFSTFKRLRHALPGWFPLVGLEGRRMNIVPVDFVAGALDHIAHQPGLDGKVFHLTDPTPKKAGEVANIFAKAAGAPQFAMRIDPGVFELVPSQASKVVGSLPPVKRIVDTVLGDLGIPRQTISYMANPTRFDSRNTQQALEGADIAVPPLEDYAPVLWDWWARHLDPDLHRDRTLTGAVRGQRVLVTGASSGIGQAAALKAGEAGAQVLLVARSRDKLEELARRIEAAGGTAHVHPADLSSQDDIGRLVREVLEQHGGVDVLVNNAGISIRRSLALSYDRLHDFQRTMQLNYFGALQLILGFVPGMRERKRGHVINVSSIGCQTNVPRFSAYVASKSALDAFSRCIATEVVDDGVDITTIYMPLVRTPMIAPTKLYDAFPAITPDEAAQMITDAMVDRPKKVATGLGNFAEISYAVAPKAVDAVLNMGYHLFPDSMAAKKGTAAVGDGAAPATADGQPEDATSTEGMAFAYLLRGVHW